MIMLILAIKKKKKKDMCKFLKAIWLYNVSNSAIEFAIIHKPMVCAILNEQNQHTWIELVIVLSANIVAQSFTVDELSNEPWVSISRTAICWKRTASYIFQNKLLKSPVLITVLHGISRAATKLYDPKDDKLKKEGKGRLNQKIFSSWYKDLVWWCLCVMIKSQILSCLTHTLN